MSKCVELSPLYRLYPKFSVVPGWEESHNNKEGLGGRLSSSQRLYVARKERKDGGQGKKEGRDKGKEGIANARIRRQSRSGMWRLWGTEGSCS